MAMGALIACLLLLGIPSKAQKKAQPVIVAYVFPQNKLIEPGDIAARKVTRINYAFANLKGGRMVNGFDAEEANLAWLMRLKQDNPALSVLVSVGGWSWSGSFSDMALTKASRSVFIDSVNEYIERNRLDGLDIDWEYPGQAGDTNHFRAEDKQNFTLLLEELRTSFDRQEGKLHRPLLLTIAAGASTGYLKHTEMAKVQHYVDTVNLMAYDYYEPGEGVAGNHAPLFVDPLDPKGVSAERSVREFEEAGVPAGKIVLGVPFYGHVWGAVGGTNHGLFQPGKAMGATYIGYDLLAKTMLGQGFERYWDVSSSVPFLYSAEKATFVSYEDSESLAAKCEYIEKEKLGGVMFWDYAGDPDGVLLDALDKGLGKSNASDRR
jgi:chitinase